MINQPVILLFNGFFWKGFKNQMELERFFGQFDMRDFFAVKIEMKLPFEI